VDLEYFRIEKKHSQKISLVKEEGGLQPISTEVGGTPTEEPKDLLSHIIQVLNESFGSDLTDEDKVNLGKIQKQLQDDEALKKEVQTSDNTESNKRFVFDKKFDVFLQGLVNESLDFYKKLTEPNRYKYVINGGEIVRRVAVEKCKS